MPINPYDYNTSSFFLKVYPRSLYKKVGYKYYFILCLISDNFYSLYNTKAIQYYKAFKLIKGF